MSYIVQPDPNPGRCRNYRSVQGMTLNSVRCLDYEGTEHVCRFPEVAVIPLVTSAIYTTTAARPPEPWIRPETTA